MSVARQLSIRWLTAWLTSLVFVFSVIAEGQNKTSVEVPQPGTQPQNSSAAGGDTSTPLPDSPGAAQTKVAVLAAEGQTSQTPSTPSSAPQQSAPQQDSTPQDSNGTVKKPLGTAAAGTLEVTGVAASRPEGAALAPEKQRRVRLLVIKLGLVAAGAVALGTTLALTAASPGRPPGSH